jgi:hypothetical protein
MRELVPSWAFSEASDGKNALCVVATAPICRPAAGAPPATWLSDRFESGLRTRRRRREGRTIAAGSAAMGGAPESVAL